MIKFEEATTAELRQFLKETHQITRHPSASLKTLRTAVNELGYDVENGSFELAGAAPVEPHHDPTDEELEAEAKSFDPEALLAALMDSGMPEAEARDLAGLTTRAHAAQNADPDELPYGAGKEHLYVTVRIRPGKGKGGNEPVPVSVNGETIYIPRGVDHPIRTPYLEALMHAEQILYEEVLTPDEFGTPHTVHRPRKSLLYPVEVLTPTPYDRKEAERVAKKAKAQIAAMAA